jgi:pSer/pThr/pTyr-binding forkhead associated (FHA) protein
MSTHKPDATIPTSIIAVRRDREVRPYYLDQIEGEGSPRRIDLVEPKLVIGRGEDASIRVATQRASRQHAFLSRRGIDYAVRDNDSRNGVFLNGLKVHSATLRDGDVLQVADCVFVYHEG